MANLIPDLFDRLFRRSLLDDTSNPKWKAIAYEQPTKNELSKLTIQQVIEKLHSEFMTSEDEFIKIREVERLNMINNPVVITKDEEYGMDLHKMGYLKAKGSINPRVVQSKLALHEDKIKAIEEVSKLIEQYRIKYPLHKFITVRTLYKICLKWGLAVGSVNDYIGDVPERCLKSIMSGPNTDSLITKVAERGSNIILNPYNRHDLIDEKLFMDEIYGAEKPEPYHDGSGGNWRTKSVALENTNLGRVDFICANKELFSDERLCYMAGEPSRILPDNDPIHLRPVYGGFLILAAWGPESNDSDVVNPVTN